MSMIRKKNSYFMTHILCFLHNGSWIWHKMNSCLHQMPLWVAFWEFFLFEVLSACHYYRIWNSPLSNTVVSTVMHSSLRSGRRWLVNRKLGDERLHQLWPSTFNRDPFPLTDSVYFLPFNFIFDFKLTFFNYL